MAKSYSKKGANYQKVFSAINILNSNIENNSANITLTRLYELSDIFGVPPDYILNYQDKSSFTNHFNNYDGNQGTIKMYQRCSDAKNLEGQLKESNQKLQTLKANIKAKSN